MAKRQLILNVARHRQKVRRELVDKIGRVIMELIDEGPRKDLVERLSALRDEDMRNDSLAYDEAMKKVTDAMGWKVTCSI